jgi:hypothetical protein
MENIQKYILPLVAGGLLSISSCGKQPGLYPVEQQTKTPTSFEKTTSTKEQSKPTEELNNTFREKNTTEKDKLGLLDINDPSIPQAVRERFKKLVPLINKSGEIYCHANSVTIDNKPAKLSAAHCGEKIIEKAQKVGFEDAPVYSSSIENLIKDRTELTNTFKLPRAMNGELVYFAIPKLRILSTTEDYAVKGMKVFVGHAKYLNTSKGTFLITEEQAPMYLVNADGSSGSMVTDSKGKIVGVLLGGLFLNINERTVTNSILSSSPHYKAASTGIPVDKSKKVIDFE